MLCHEVVTQRIAEVAEWVFSADQELSAVLSLPDGEDGRSPCFCVGSVNYKAGEVEPSSGRLMLFSLSSVESSARSPETMLRMAVTEETPGCVYALAYSRGMIVAAVNTSVRLKGMFGHCFKVLANVASHRSSCTS